MLPAASPLSPKTTVSWLLPLATSVNGVNTLGVEQVLSHRTTVAPPLRNFCSGAYAWIST